MEFHLNALNFNFVKRFYSDEKSTFLPSSVHGSPRHLKELSDNGLSIVSELGSADVFITLTCNPNWPEIHEKLLPHQTAFDRPDIVTQVI